MKNILVAHDGSKSSVKALKKAFELAEKYNSVLHVVSVVPELYLTELLETDRERIVEALTIEAREMMEQIKTKAREGVIVRTIIRQGNPAEEILAASKKVRAEMIITGSHGRHGAQKFLLGSVSSKIVDHAECSVLVVK